MRKKKTALVVALLLIGVTALGLGAAVYAKYIASLQKTGTATVAKWAFSTDNTAGTITCDPTLTYDTGTLVSGKIAPGTYGECEIEISNANSEVGVDYVVKPNSITNQPANLKLYKDAGHTEPFSASNTITGFIPAKQTDAVKASVYWVWEYQDGTTAYDDADTADGEAAKTMTLVFDVTGTQVQPTE